jgi:hypothetical protein
MRVLSDIADKAGHVASSATSYAVGTGGIIVGAAHQASQLDWTGFGGGLIILVRLTYDIVRLYRFWKNKEPESKAAKP